MTETYDFESITIAASAIGFTAGKIAVDNDNGKPVRAVCKLENAPIRYTVDGSTTPTASVGHKMEIGETLIIDSLKDLKSFSAIRTSGVSGVLKVSYEREVS
jgi:hypothetical protein